MKTPSEIRNRTETLCPLSSSSVTPWLVHAHPGAPSLWALGSPVSLKMRSLPPILPPAPCAAPITPLTTVDGVSCLISFQGGGEHVSAGSCGCVSHPITVTVHWKHPLQQAAGPSGQLWWGWATQEGTGPPPSLLSWASDSAGVGGWEQEVFHRKERVCGCVVILPMKAKADTPHSLPGLSFSFCYPFNLKRN